MKNINTVRKPALLVSDVQNDFIEDGGWFIKLRSRPYSAEEKAKLYQACRALIDAAHAAGVPVVYTCTVSRADRLDSACSIKVDRQSSPGSYLVDGTWGAQIVDALVPESRDIIVRKTGPSAFQFTPLHRILTNLGVDSLIMVGGPLYESVNVTGRDAAAQGYIPLAVPDALYPLNYPHPEYLRMRVHVISMAEALERLRRPSELGLRYEYQPASSWRSLLPKSCLLLIDLINGFVRPGRYWTGPDALWPEYVYREEDYRRLLANNARLIRWAHEQGIPVINVKTIHRQDGPTLRYMWTHSLRLRAILLGWHFA